MVATATPSPLHAADEVVLVDADGTPVGSAPRLSVHDEQTPLHLAFSSYVGDGEGRVLLTRRALDKRTWPGVWTNTCCGHPRPGEPLEDAVRRRMVDELGLEVGELTCTLPDFAYRATDASGVVENEVCPVFTARTHPGSTLSPNASEVMEWRWVEWGSLAQAVRATPFAFSPWAALQVPQLDERTTAWL
ncbi:isopentenyl-diphosphate Delta-isomerase [Microlunatus flavus]|uniref:Isopentenyl-diphosphate Delta-isomerase n=1 Tax=Microlunatus flavus TaxID=1036181 RepID=A0A1H8ZC66_9ACTN|nr:isopentenyl-diphosphate Delta-isomerase [Microlunatus flavus]SEP62005.1 isopentenyl-diphosphate delta-isomerase [Microlunatus flavus]